MAMRTALLPISTRLVLLLGAISTARATNPLLRVHDGASVPQAWSHAAMNSTPLLSAHDGLASPVGADVQQQLLPYEPLGGADARRRLRADAATPCSLTLTGFCGSILAPSKYWMQSAPKNGHAWFKARNDEHSDAMAYVLAWDAKSQQWSLDVLGEFGKRSGTASSIVGFAHQITSRAAPHTGLWSVRCGGAWTSSVLTVTSDCAATQPVCAAPKFATGSSCAACAASEQSAPASTRTGSYSASGAPTAATPWRALAKKSCGAAQGKEHATLALAKVACLALDACGGVADTGAAGVFRACVLTPPHPLGFAASLADSAAATMHLAPFSVRMCDACAAGRYRGASSCLSCPAGQSSAAGATSAAGCAKCAAGKREVGRVCAPCAAGTYSAAAGATACTVCPASKVGPAGSALLSNCAACAANSYRALSGRSYSCVACDAVGASTSKNVSCTSCVSGYGATLNATRFKCAGALGAACPAGLTSAAATAGCAACAAGKFATGSGTCEHCDFGRFQDAAGVSACKLCPAGKTTVNLGNFAASGCGACAVTISGFCRTDLPTSLTMSQSPQAGHAVFYSYRSGKLFTLTWKVSRWSLGSAGTGEVASLADFSALPLKTSKWQVNDCTTAGGPLAKSPKLLSVASTCAPPVQCEAGRVQLRAGIEQTNNQKWAALRQAGSLYIGAFPGHSTSPNWAVRVSPAETGGCGDCPAGSSSEFHYTAWTTECQACPAGTYSDQEGQASCKACPSQTTQGNVGQRKCGVCAKTLVDGAPTQLVSGYGSDIKGGQGCIETVPPELATKWTVMPASWFYQDKELATAGLKATFFNFTQKCSLPTAIPAAATASKYERVDLAIHVPWTKTAGDWGIPAVQAAKFSGKFYVTWEGYIKVPEGKTYGIGTSSDAGSQITIDGKAVLRKTFDGVARNIQDEWCGKSYTSYMKRGWKQVALTAGAHSFKAEVSKSGALGGMIVYLVEFATAASELNFFAELKQRSEILGAVKGADLCGWRSDVHGAFITCAPVDGATRVMSVVLKNLGIKAIPKSIGALGELRSADFSSNKIKALPAELADCGMLMSLELGRNQITNASTVDWMKMTSLVQLRLESNLIALAPSQLPTKLYVVYLQQNRLKSIPKEYGLQLNQMQYFDASFNLLEDFPVVDWPKLTSLKLGGNPLGDLDLDLVTAAVDAAKANGGKVKTLDISFSKNPLALQFSGISKPKQVCHFGAAADPCKFMIFTRDAEYDTVSYGGLVVTVKITKAATPTAAGDVLAAVDNKDGTYSVTVPMKLLAPPGKYIAAVSIDGSPLVLDPGMTTMFNPVPVTSEPEQCENGFYSIVRQDQLKMCSVDGKTGCGSTGSLQPGGSSVCKTAWDDARDIGGKCVALPKYAGPNSEYKCGSVVANQFLIQRGWWSQGNGTRLHYCPMHYSRYPYNATRDPEACTGSSQMLTHSVEDSAGSAVNFSGHAGCSANYTGIMCGSCRYVNANLIYAKTIRGDPACAMCPKPSQSWLMVLALLVVCVTGSVFLIQKNNSSVTDPTIEEALSDGPSDAEMVSVSVRIMLAFMTVQGLIGDLNLGIFDMVKKTAGVKYAEPEPELAPAQVAAAAIEMANMVGEPVSQLVLFLECLIKDQDTPYIFRKLLITAWTPLVSIVGVTAVYGLRTLLLRKKFNVDHCISGIVVLLFLIHTSVVKTALSIFNCIQLEDELYVMASEQGVECWTDLHWSHIWSAGIPAIFFSIAIPLGALLLLRSAHAKDNISEMNPHAVDGGSVGSGAPPSGGSVGLLALNPLNAKGGLNDMATKRKWAFLYKGYERNFWYWEFVVLARKIVVCVIVVFLKPQGATVMSLAALIVIQFALLAHITQEPYQYKSQDNLETTSLFVSFFTFVLALMASDETIKTDGEFTAKEFLMTVLVLLNFFMVYKVFWQIAVSAATAVKALLHKKKSEAAHASVKFSPRGSMRDMSQSMLSVMEKPVEQRGKMLNSETNEWVIDKSESGMKENGLLHTDEYKEARVRERDVEIDAAEVDILLAIDLVDKVKKVMPGVQDDINAAISELHDVKNFVLQKQFAIKSYQQLEEKKKEVHDVKDAIIAAGAFGAASKRHTPRGTHLLDATGMVVSEVEMQEQESLSETKLNGKTDSAGVASPAVVNDKTAETDLPGALP